MKIIQRHRGAVAWLVLLVTITGCATPREHPYAEEIREGRLFQGVYVAADGAYLPMHAWLPKEKPKAVVLSLHGFNDYGRAFLYPGIMLSRRGIAVYAYDQRGFGACKGHGIWAGQSNLTRDLRYAVQAVRNKHPDTPLFVLGESMGGAVVALAVTQPGFPHIEGVILSAPAVWGGETMNRLYRLSLELLAHSMPDVTLTGRGLKILASDNIPMLRALGRDPLVIKETRIDAVYGIVQLMDNAFHAVPRIRQPLLVLYGENDQVIPKSPVAHISGHLPENAQIRHYPDGYHMLLRDRQGHVVLADIAQWIEQVIGATPVADAGVAAMVQNGREKAEEKY